MGVALESYHPLKHINVGTCLLVCPFQKEFPKKIIKNYSGV